MIGSVLGGIGLFLLGMSLLISGLQAVAGDKLRSLLRASTRNHLTGLASGAVATALVQSSSATTLTVVGFVGAGLISFPQSIGLLFGANLGTTSTAWIVSLLGLKIKIDVIALPLVGIGAGLKVFGGKRLGQAGLAVAGFGLIFVGIDILQEGMASVAETIDPASLAQPGVMGAVVLVLVGAIMTVIMQSSSAAIATTLAAVHAGTLGLDQAVLLVIGQNVGTTVTALMGAAGGSVPARQTAVAHVLFNVVAAAVALLILPVFLFVVKWISSMTAGDDPTIQIAIFHTIFKLLGIAILLPISAPFARFVERIVPERRQGLTRRLSEGGSSVPEVRLEAARQTVVEVMSEVVASTRRVVDPQSPGGNAEGRLDACREALASTRAFMEPLRTDPTSQQAWARHVALLHAIDHLDRLIEACDDREPATRVRRDEAVREVHDGVVELLQRADAVLASSEDVDAYEAAERLASDLSDYRRIHRPKILEQTASSDLSPLVAEGRLEAIRWGERLSFHLWRALHHLRGADLAESSAELPTEPDALET
ncbi:MAG: Na/Pi cotransporter family protein [Deltaproteobacteria bacterium]|nr:MAG: Na/Pi cotransporter family protein [Deltaproteobacteria bacterium]